MELVPSKVGNTPFRIFNGVVPFDSQQDCRERRTILRVACVMESHAMPRFYFNFRNGDLLAKDDEGRDLSGLEEAKTVALVAARELVADNVKAAAKYPLLAVIITNEAGEELVTIPAKDALPEPLK
jgi:hypothetical protein